MIRRWLFSFGLATLFAFTFEAPAAAQTTLYIVRHAEKATEPANDPPLSEAGQARAAELAHVLRSVDLRAIYVTPYRRTRETAAPIAKLKQLAPREIGPDKMSDFADSVLTRHAGESILVIGHVDTPASLLQFMRSEQGVVIGDCNYDDLIVVTSYKKSEAPLVQHLHYGAEPPKTKR